METDPDFRGLHVPEQCLNDKAKLAMKGLIVRYLMKFDACPECLHEILYEIADAGDEIWNHLNTNTFKNPH